MEISIIICCYNSADRIKKTIQQLSKLELNGLSCELILVDNKCADNTIEIVRDIWREALEPYELRVLFEETPGLFFARRKGIIESKGDLILFCDDDNWLNTNYIIRAKSIFDVFADVGIVGGRSLPIGSWEDYPNWFFEHAKAFAVGQQYKNSGIAEGKILWGAGMVLRGEVLRKTIAVDFPIFCTGRIGAKVVSGDDAEICAWMLLLGYKLYYDNELVLTHNLDKNKISRNYLDALYASFSEASKLLKPYWDIIDFQNKFTHRKWKWKCIIFIKLILKRYRTNYYELELKLLFPKFNIQVNNLNYKSILSAKKRYLEFDPLHHHHQPKQP